MWSKTLLGPLTGGDMYLGLHYLPKAFPPEGECWSTGILRHIAQACLAVRDNGAQASLAVHDLYADYVSSRHTYCDGWCQSELPYVTACRCRVVVASGTCGYRVVWSAETGDGLLSYVSCLVYKENAVVFL
jgi:hypothetical protein